MISENNQSIIYFEKAGMQTLVQDSGRYGQAFMGVPRSGYADRVAAQAANMLVGNRLNAPLIEVCILGPIIHFLSNAEFAITGAEFSTTLSETRISNGIRYKANKGDVLKFGTIISGCRSYISIQGELEGPLLEGSTSPLFSNSKSVFAFPYIEKGRELLFNYSEFEKRDSSVIHHRGTGKGKIKIVAGPDIAELGKNVLGWLTSNKFTVEADSNRMGIRLKSKEVASHESEIISVGVLPGCIQLDRAGNPIILMPDAQTTGGYPRIAKVIDSDLDLCAQFKPGDHMEFELVDFKEGKKALRR